MLIPLRLAGLALAGRTFYLKNGSNFFSSKGKPMAKSYTKPRPKPVYKKKNIEPMPNPLQNLAKGLSTSLSSLSTSLNNLTTSISRAIQKPPREDYNNVITGFLPPNATLLAPQFPGNGDRFQLVDLDGDSQTELVSSYRLNDAINTMVLKKQNDRWSKIADVSNCGYDNLNYIGFSDVTGEGKKQLLLGLKNNNNPGVLHGYALKDGNLTQLFTHKYKRLELLNSPNVSESRLAFWNNDNTVLDNIEVKHWNGTELESVNNPAQYYTARVLPVYGQRVKQMPQSPTHWFRLADALTKAGMYSDGLAAVQLGVGLNPPSPLKEEFLALREHIQEKMKK